MRREPMRDGYLLAAGLWVIAIAVGLVPPGGDATTFFANRWPDPYGVTDYASGAGFYYSPPIALLFAPLTAFGLPLFSATLTATGFAALYGILGRWAWLGLLFPPVWWDLSAGNVNTLLGFVAVTGGAWWSVALLTKVTPGVGLLWHVVRQEWRAAGIALGITSTVCLVSALAAPQLWRDWVGSLLSNSIAYVGPGYFTIEVPLLPRLVGAIVLVTIGGRRDWRWALPVSVVLAMPVLWWSCLAALVGVAAKRRAGWSGSHSAPGRIPPDESPTPHQPEHRSAVRPGSDVRSPGPVRW
jgi:hypothetical protein